MDHWTSVLCGLRAGLVLVCADSGGPHVYCIEHTLRLQFVFLQRMRDPQSTAIGRQLKQLLEKMTKEAWWKDSKLEPMVRTAVTSAELPCLEIYLHYYCCRYH